MPKEESTFWSVLNTISCQTTKQKGLMKCEAYGFSESGLHEQTMHEYSRVFSVEGKLAILVPDYETEIPTIWIKTVPVGSRAKILVKRRPSGSMPPVGRGALELKVV